jgi:hypothetical protein
MDFNLIHDVFSDLLPILDTFGQIVGEFSRHLQFPIPL